MHILINSMIEPSRILQNLIEILRELDGHPNTQFSLS